jgi:hypothetical protein
LPITACTSATIAIVSSTRVVMSQMRTSTVSKNGWARTSHQIFFALSMQCVFTSRSTYRWNSAYDANELGMPVRGKRLKISLRRLFKPDCRPSQNGDDVDSARMCGRK